MLKIIGIASLMWQTIMENPTCVIESGKKLTFLNKTIQPLPLELVAVVFMGKRICVLIFDTG